MTHLSSAKTNARRAPNLSQTRQEGGVSGTGAGPGDRDHPVVSGDPQPSGGLGGRPDGVGPAAQEVVDLLGPLRRYVSSRVDDQQDVEDFVQETITRVLASRERLAEVSLLPFALTIARNLMATGYREQDLFRRNAPRLLDRRDPPRPEQLVEAAEERRALSAALTTLPEEHRDLLVEHVLADRTLTDAARDGADAASLAARMARTRARLRVDYLLALRQVTLPTDRCRPILLSVSAGDKRRQTALRAGAHLVNCPTCSDLGEPLVQRRRALAGLGPWLALGAWHGRLEHFVRQHPAASAGTAAAAAASTVVIGVLAVGSGPAPAPTAGANPQALSTAASAAGPFHTQSPVTDDGVLIGRKGPVSAQAAVLRDMVGQVVTAKKVRVLSVPADEGFWIGQATARVWVQLPPGRESSAHIVPGQRVSFRAQVRTHDASFAAQVGVTGSEGATDLDAQGIHLAVRGSSLRVLP